MWGGQRKNKGSFAREEVGGAQKFEEARGAPPWDSVPICTAQTQLAIPNTLSMAQRGQGNVGRWRWERKRGQTA